MAMLYASLRSLLPIEYVKGKRSISDHMYEAANYIRHQQKKIRELAETREGLRRVAACDDSSRKSTNVIVQPCWTGVEVQISSESGMVAPLSRVVTILMEARLDVVSCISRNTDNMAICTFQCEIGDRRDVNLNELQQKLIEISCPTSSSS